MNKKRRKAIDEAIALLNTISGPLASALEIIETAAEEEREAYDNLSEGLQASEKGSAIDEAATALEDVKETLQSVDVEELIGKLNEAQGE